MGAATLAWVDINDASVPNTPAEVLTPLQFANVVYCLPGHTVHRLLSMREGRLVYRVKLASPREEEEDAVVVVARPARACEDGIPEEIACLRRLGVHPNIARVHEWCQLPGGCYAMKMDVYERFSYGMNDTSVRCYLRAVLTALAHAHLRGVCHRDVALENTLWDPRQSTFVLIDFEGAALHRPQGYSSDVGRDGYDAPEKTRCLRRAGAYTERAELYSVGVMFWRLVRGGGGGSGKVPSHQATAKWLQKMHWRAERPAGADLMSRLLAHDPNDRITAEHALAHAYFEDK